MFIGRELVQNWQIAKRIIRVNEVLMFCLLVPYTYKQKQKFTGTKRSKKKNGAKLTPFSVLIGPTSFEVSRWPFSSFPANEQSLA